MMDTIFSCQIFNKSRITKKAIRTWYDEHLHNNNQRTWPI